MKLTLKIELVVGHNTSEQRLSEKSEKSSPGQELVSKKIFLFFFFFSRHFLNTEAQPPASDTTRPKKKSLLGSDATGQFITSDSCSAKAAWMGNYLIRFLQMINFRFYWFICTEWLSDCGNVVNITRATNPNTRHAVKLMTGNIWFIISTRWGVTLTHQPEAILVEFNMIVPRCLK